MLTAAALALTLIAAPAAKPKTLPPARELTTLLILVCPEGNEVDKRLCRVVKPQIPQATRATCEALGRVMGMAWVSHRHLQLVDTKCVAGEVPDDTFEQRDGV